MHSILLLSQPVKVKKVVDLRVNYLMFLSQPPTVVGSVFFGQDPQSKEQFHLRILGQMPVLPHTDEGESNLDYRGSNPPINLLAYR